VDDGIPGSGGGALGVRLLGAEHRSHRTCPNLSLRCATQQVTRSSGYQLAFFIGITGVIRGAVANFMFLPFYPFWSVVVLTLNVIIIWELTRERDDRRELARLPGASRIAAPGRA
jgi:hypothetical protein